MQTHAPHRAAPVQRPTAPWRARLRRRPPLLAGAVLALLLAGCANTGGIAPRAQAIAPASLGLSAAVLPEVDARWWQAFGDAELDALVQRAWAQNPSLQVAAARVERAAALADNARALERPTAGLGLDLTRQRYSENGSVPAPLAGSVRDSGTLQARIGWELDFFGRNRATLDAALGAERAAQADVQAARVLLATRVVRSYVGLARALAQRGVAERTLAQRGELLSLVRQRVDAGLDTNVELRQGEGALPDTRLQIAQLDEQIALARNQLSLLTAQPPAALASLSPALAQVQAQALPVELGADLLGRRADIVAARWRVEAASHDVAVARLQFYPNVNLMAFAGFTAIGLGQLLDAGSRQAGFGPAITLPLFDTGRLRANLQGRAADLDGAVQAYNGAVNDAVHEVADQVTSLRSITEQQREQAQAQARLESAYDLAVQRYRAGLGTYLVVLNAETSLLAQRRMAVDLQARALDARALLMQGLGGGWQDDGSLRPPAVLAAAAQPSIRMAPRP
jgi:NodT family efflux transporter outer membrane factor (OMF) lipoprotein